MARRRKKRTLRPRVPSRVKRRKRGAKKAEGHQHPELVGLALLALGVFLGFVVWADWNGGYVGLWIGEGLDALIGSATLGLPAALAIVGALMVTRSDLVDVRPFRTGLFVLACGLMITLGKDEGGYVGTLLGGGLALAIGSTGVAIAGILTLLAGGAARDRRLGRARCSAPPAVPCTARHAGRSRRAGPSRGCRCSRAPRRSRRSRRWLRSRRRWTW